MTQGTPPNVDFEVSLPRSVLSDITPLPTDSANSHPVQNAELKLPIILRILSVALCLFLIAGFTLASKLEPSPRGYGTHQQLGLPPCSIQLLFAVPCPSCGMTTSFSWFVRGEILQSANANLAGLYLATLCLLMIPSTLAISFWNLSLPAKKTQLWVVILSCIYFLIAFVQWVVRFLLEAS